MRKKKNNKNSNLEKKENNLLFNTYRNAEFVGDSLLSFIVRDYYFCSGVERNITIKEVYKVVSNNHLSACFDILKMELNPIFHKNNTLIKAKANQMEYYIYYLYRDKGFNTVKKFIIENIIKNYYAS